MNQPAARLISQLIPSKYKLHISQDSTSLAFDGIVDITASLPTSTNTIQLHCKQINIQSASVNGLMATYTLREGRDELVLQLPQEISGGVTINISFSGTITPQMHGLYPCTYIDNGVEKRLLATQFESHHAREVFPCIDEPEAKAVFELSITTATTDTVLSNTPILSETLATENSATKTVYFSATPKMSTYLLAWVTGDLVCMQSSTSSGVLLSVYSTSVQAGKGQFALDFAVQALGFMDDYFSVAYPLAKCDLVALPDFSAAGMENWGLITFRESCLLIEPDDSDLDDKQYVADVVAHELAHQWFGNLVTMCWWDDLWLNEGFASWMSFFVVDALYPEWNIWEQFSSSELRSGLRADALANTHPVIVDIDSPDAIAEAFDEISYNKGCAVINLLYRYIGSEAFRSGLQEYLRTFSYSNTTTSDLWTSWSKSSGKDVAKFMNAWTKTPGFPLVSVDDYGVTQQHFLLDNTAQPSEQIWPIPLMSASGDNTIFETKFSATLPNTKLNSGQSGFYRVLYSGKLGGQITRQIHSAQMPAIDTLGVITDASEAAKAGLCTTTSVLELFAGVGTYQNEPLVSTVIGELADYRQIFSGAYEGLKPYIGKIISPNLARLGFELSDGESINDHLLRPTILATSAYCDNQDFIDYALDKFVNANDASDLRSDIRSVIYYTVASKDGSVHTFEKLLRWYSSTDLPGESSVIAGALCSFESPELTNRSLEYALSGGVKLQDVRFWAAGALASRHSKHAAWNWLKTNWQFFVDNFGSEKDLGLFVKAAAQGFASVEHLDDYTTFFSSVDITGADRTFAQGKETIAWQTAWKSRDEKLVLDWLSHYKDL